MTPLPSLSVSSSSPVVASQSWIFPARSPVARLAPSGENARHSTTGRIDGDPAQQLAPGQAPDPDLASRRPRGGIANRAHSRESGSIGGDGEVSQHLRIRPRTFKERERADRIAGCGIPELNQAVRLRGDGGLAIGREADADERGRLPERSDLPVLVATGTPAGRVAWSKGAAIAAAPRPRSSSGATALIRPRNIALDMLRASAAACPETTPVSIPARLAAVAARTVDRSSGKGTAAAPASGAEPGPQQRRRGSQPPPDQPRPQQVLGTRQPPGDRPLGPPQRRGRLILGLPFQVAEHDRTAVLLGQALQLRRRGSTGPRSVPDRPDRNPAGPAPAGRSPGGGDPGPVPAGPPVPPRRGARARATPASGRSEPGASAPGRSPGRRPPPHAGLPVPGGRPPAPSVRGAARSPRTPLRWHPACRRVNRSRSWPSLVPATTPS